MTYLNLSVSNPDEKTTQIMGLQLKQLNHVKKGLFDDSNPKPTTLYKARHGHSLHWILQVVNRLFIVSTCLVGQIKL